MTLFGASDREFTSVVTQMVGTARRLKSAIESSPIRVPIEAAAPGTVTRSFGQGIRVFGNGVRGGSEGPGMGSSLMGGLGAMGTMAGGLAGAAGGAAMLVVGVNRVLSKVSEAGREQEKWTAEVMKTSGAYVQLATAALKPMDAIAKAKADALADAQKAATEIGAKTNEGMGDGKNAFSRGFDVTMTNAAAMLSYVPGLNKAYDFGDGRSYGTKQDEKARIGEEQMNRVAIAGNAAAKRAQEEARAKQLKDAQDKAVAEGKALSASAEALQREQEARAKEIAAREKAKQLATEDLRVSSLGSEAIVKRLTGHEKEAQLLEAKAAYLQKHLELERESALTNEQKSAAMMENWKIFQLQEAQIEKSFRGGGRSVGVDMSVVGGAAAAMSGDSVSSEILKEAREQKELLKKIAQNTESGGPARMG